MDASEEVARVQAQMRRLYLGRRSPSSSRPSSSIVLHHDDDDEMTDHQTPDLEQERRVQQLRAQVEQLTGACQALTLENQTLTLNRTQMQDQVQELSVASKIALAKEQQRRMSIERQLIESTHHQRTIDLCF